MADEAPAGSGAPSSSATTATPAAPATTAPAIDYTEAGKAIDSAQADYAQLDGSAPAPEGDAAPGESAGQPAPDAEGAGDAAPAEGAIDVATLLQTLQQFTAGQASPPAAPAAAAPGAATTQPEPLAELTAEQEAAFLTEFGGESAKPVLATVKALQKHVKDLSRRAEDLTKQATTEREEREHARGQETVRKVHDWFDGQAKAGYGDFFGTGADKASPQQLAARKQTYELAGAIHGAYVKMGQPITDARALESARAIVTQQMSVPDAVQAVRSQVQVRHHARTMPSARSAGLPPQDPMARARTSIDQAVSQFNSERGG